jgi:hypothetical protein
VHGLELHPTVAFTPEGVALGVLDAQCWKRDPEATPRFRRPVEEKEGVKWLKGLAAAQAAQARCPQSCVVSVGDCEADMFELFRQAQSSPRGVKFLVRAYRPRPQSQPGAPESWTDLASRPPGGSVGVQLPRRGRQPARKAELSVRFGPFELKAPEYLQPAPPVRLWAIRLEEVHPPPGVSPVKWLLWTNLPVESWEAAVEKTRWYALRFQIEVLFRTLKSGCRIEERQLATGRRLENALAIDLIVAWRILYLSRQARQAPEQPAGEYFEGPECQVLHALARPAGVDSAPLTVGEAVRIIARWGGFLDRKSDGEPGAQTLWRGLHHLADVTFGFQLARRAHPLPVSSNTDYG